MIVDAVSLENSLAGAEVAAEADPTSYHRSRVPRELLAGARLSRMLVDAGVDWTVIAVAALATLRGPAWLLPIGIGVIAGRLHAFGVILHDACHFPRAQDDWRTRLLELLVGYPIGSSVRAMAYHHLRHHRDAGRTPDPYFKAGIEESRLLYAIYVGRGAILVLWWTVRAFVGVGALWLPRWREAYARAFLQDRSGDLVGETEDVRECLRREPRQAVFTLLLLAATWRWPGPLVVTYWIPAVLAGLLSAHRLLREHVYVRTADRQVDTILGTTRDHEWGWLGSLLFFPRNIGLHAVHHLHPHVASENLPALKQWYLENHPGYPRARPK